MNSFSSQSAKKVFPRVLSIYNDQLAFFKSVEVQKVRELEDPSIKDTKAILKNYIESFMLTKSLIEKLSILEEISFWLKFEFTNKHGDYDFARANVVLKMVIGQIGCTFELLVHFKLTVDFFNESKGSFLAEEFFTDFDLTLNSMFNF